MSSFRVQNARFRILKGGKIGLCLSITLIGGILFFPTSSYSQTFFDTTVGTTLTAIDISVQKFTDQDTTSTATYNETITPQDIIFKPSKVQSSFVGIQNNEFDGTNSVTIYSAGVTTGSNSFKVLDGEYTVTDGVIYNYDTYYYEEYSPSTNFTITLESGSKANDIKKESSIYYNVSNPNTYSNLSTSYTANIILKGNNVVSGTTNLGIDGNIIIEEDGVNFQNDVTAGEIEIYTDKTAQFGGNITGNIVGNTGTLELNGNKVQTINGDINSANTTITSGTTLELVNDKNISSTVTGDGNLILQGNNIISNSVNLTGDVTTKGTSNFQNSLTADKININSGITTVTGDINSTNTNISSTLDAKKNITSTVIGSGTLNMNGTVDQTITGTVGVENLNIANGSNKVIANDNITSTNTNISSTLDAKKNITSTVIGSGTLNMNGTVDQTITGTVGVENLNIANGSNKVIANDNITSTNTNISSTLDAKKNITSTVIGSGTLNMNGTVDQTITGTVGVENLNIANGSNKVIANDNITSTNTNISSTLDAKKNITSTVIGSGTLNMNGTVDQTITGTVGVENLNIANGSNKVIANDNITSTNTNISSTLDAKKNITSTVIGSGTLNMNGTVDQTITGTVGVENLNIANGSNKVIANDNITSTNTNISSTLDAKKNITSTVIGSGTLNMNGTVDQTITGTVGVENLNIANGSNKVIANDNITSTNTNISSKLDAKGNITSNINGGLVDTGTLIMSGTSQTITGDIGNTSSLNAFNINSGTTTVSGNVNSTNTTILSGATLNSKGNITSDVAGAGTLELSGSKVQTVDGNITSANTSITSGTTLQLKDGKNIDSIINGGGTLTLLGSSIISNEIQSLEELKINSDGSTSKFEGVVNSNKITSTGTGSTTFDKETITTNLAINNGNMTFNEDLDATNTTIGSGKSNLNNQASLNGTNINFTNTAGELNLSDGSNITVTNITTNSNNRGNINISGDSIISGDIGTLANKLKEINILGDSTKTIDLKDDINAVKTTISEATVDFNKNSGNTNTNLVFTGKGTANLYQGITGTIDFAGNDALINIKDGKNISGDVKTTSNNTGIINFEGDGEITGTVGNIAFGIKELNVNTQNQQDKDSSGDVSPDFGLFLHRDIYADRINLQNNATLVLDDDADILNIGLADMIVLATDANNKGNVIFKGSSTISGEVGEDSKKLKSITAGGSDSIVTFEDKVYVKDLNYSSDGDIVLEGKDLNNEALKGNINFNNMQGTLTFADGVNLNTINTTFQDANSARLIFAGDSTVSGILGGNTPGKSTFNTIEAGNDGNTVTFEKDLYATNLEITGDGGIVNLNGNFTGNNINYQDDGIINLADKKAINSNITTNDEYGTLNLLSDSSINGTIGTIDNKLKEINSAQNSKTSNLNGNTFAKDLNVGTGILNLNGNFTGDNLNYEANGVVNLADNKVVDSKILTTTDNQGILNTLKNAEFKQQIGQDGKKLKDINTAKSDSTTTFKEDVYAQNLNLQENGTVNLGGNFKGDKIDFKDNATLNIAKDKNISSKIVSQDENIGEINIAGSTIISGEIADSLNKIRAIKLNGKNSSSTFEKDTFVKDLNLNEKLTLNLNGNLEAENLNYNSDATINLANQKNIDAKINTLNNGEGTLNLLGSSNINKKVGSDTNRLKEIKTGASGSTSEFKDNVYANKTTIKDEGTVNFKENLYSNIYFGGNGTVNIEDNKAVISQTQPFTTTIADGVGNLNYKGATTLTNDIGSIDKRLNTVKFASDANRENIEQKLAYDVYAKNTVIGNGSNKVLIDFVDDVKFAGNLNIKDGATLNIKDKKLDVKDNIKVDKNSTLNFDVQTTDLSSGSAVVGGKSGQITADSLTMESDAKFNITYDGTWEGKGQYNLIVTQNDIDTKYRATEESGFVRDNSIIDSTVEVVGKNLVLKADRTTDGSHKAEDLYIVKSGIGNDYSNGASQSLAKLANEKAREGALAKIIRDIEYLEDGKTITSTKKQEMIDIQRKLAPNPSGVVSQNIADASNINKTSIKGRLNEMRTSNIEDSIQAYEGKGLSSGDSYTVGDSTLWLKTTASKTKQDDVGVYEGFNTKSYGFVAGLDKNVGDSSIIGISTSYMDTKATQNSHQTDTNSIGVSLYGSKEFELGYIEGQLNYTQHSSDTSRTANSGDLTSKVKADEMGARIEAGVHIPVDNGAYITPYAGVEYSQVNQKGYTEKGTSYQNDALKVDKYKEDKTTAEVGIKATSRIELDNALIIPQVSFAVAKDFGTSNPEIKAQFVGGGDKFVTPSRKPDDMIYKVGAGVEARITNDTKIRFDLNYDRSKDGDFEGYSGNVTLGISF